MKATKKLVATILLSIGGNVLAYDTSTHTAMTAAAAGKSRIGASPSFSAQIQTLGLRDYNFVLGDKYIDIGPQLLTRIGSGFEDKIIDDVTEANRLGPIQIPGAYSLTGWLMRGAIREDDNTVEIPPVYRDEPGGTFNRPYGHFHDPQNDRGLTVAGIGILPRATDWALSPDTSILGRQNHYKVSDAREAMWRALTLKARAMDGTFNDNVTPPDWSPPSKEHLRKAYWATTFRALGDAVHLLQDMAQPQHTRNDMHSGLGCVPGVGPCALGHDSFFEKYLKAKTLKEDVFTLDDGILSASNGPFKVSLNALDYTSYNNIPSFPDYSDYFVSSAADGGNANGKGLANYSNRGFYSAGTNINRVFTTGDQPSPPPTGAGLGTVVLTDTGTNGEYLRDMAGNLLRGRITFRTGIVRDTAGGADAADVKLSSVGVWDQFLEQKGWLSLYSLNYYNYDDQAKLLIPRAVAYSAGLIDYFFRGQLEIRPPEEGVYAILDHSSILENCKDNCGFRKIKLKVANSTPDIAVSGSNAIVPQLMTGGTLVAVAKYHKNTCYTTDLEGEYDSRSGETITAYVQHCRSAEEEITVSQPLANQSPVSCNAAVAGDCDTKANASTTLTFNFSTPIPINATDLYLQVVYRGPLGSEQDAVVVATKDIAEPTYFSVVNVSDYLICYNNSWVFKDANGNLPAWMPTMVDGKLATELYKASNYNFWRMTLQPAQDTTLARVDTVQPKEFARVAVLVEPGRSYNHEIDGYVPPEPPPFRLVTAGLNQSGFTAAGSPTINLFDYKASSFRKVKANASLMGYNYNTQGTTGICLGLALPDTEPGYPPPTAMRPVTISFP